MDRKSKNRRDDEKSVEKSRRIRSESDTEQQMNEEEDRSNIIVINGEELEFEDPFGDDFEPEDLEDEEIEEVDEEEDTTEVIPENDDDNEPKQVWRPGIDQIPEGEELEYDPRAYTMYHSLRAEWPCLSFDFLKDNLGEGRLRFPMTMYAVTGSQADAAENNKITLLKLSELRKTGGNDSDSDSEDEDDDVDDDPTLEHVDIPHIGGINRIRNMPQKPGIIATMADSGHAHIYDISATFQSMLAKGPRVPAPTKPLFTFKGHREEGFAIDWSPVTSGRLATGDCAGAINIWNSTESGSWQVDNKPYLGHKNSVEDIQWSPTEPSVFISASSDKSIRIWDTRGRSGPQITVDSAHNEDINVISWNRNVAYLLASGCDDGSFKVWDLRAIKSSTTLANFTYHKGPITSIEWAPHDESVVALSSADDQLTIWDLSVEADVAANPDPVLADYPAQLLFIHQGQHNMKELHHHPQIPGVIFSTAEDGFNIFKPAISVSS